MNGAELWLWQAIRRVLVQAHSLRWLAETGRMMAILAREAPLFPADLGAALMLEPNHSALRVRGCAYCAAGIGV